MPVPRRPPQIRSVSHFPSQHRAAASTLLLVQWAFIAVFPCFLLLLSGFIHSDLSIVLFSHVRMGLGVTRQWQQCDGGCSKVLTRAAGHRHLHCTGCLDEAGARLCRLSLLLQRLALACLNFIHIMFYKQIEGFFPCDKSLWFYFILTCTL